MSSPGVPTHPSVCKSGPGTTGNHSCGRDRPRLESSRGPVPRRCSGHATDVATGGGPEPGCVPVVRLSNGVRTPTGEDPTCKGTHRPLSGPGREKRQRRRGRRHSGPSSPKEEHVTPTIFLSGRPSTNLFTSASKEPLLWTKRGRTSTWRSGPRGLVVTFVPRTTPDRGRGPTTAHK